MPEVDRPDPSRTAVVNSGTCRNRICLSLKQSAQNVGLLVGELNPPVSGKLSPRLRLKSAGCDEPRMT